MSLLPIQNRPAQLVAVIGVAIGVIVCVLFAAVAWVLHVSAISLDRQNAGSEVKLVHSLIDANRKTLANGVADYSAWTELYRYLNGPRDPAWERENLGPYISKTFPVDAVLVASSGGRIVYSYTRDTQFTRMVTDVKTIRRVAQLSFTRERPGIQMPVVGFVALNGIPALIAASPIRDSASRLRAGYALIEVRVMAPAALNKLGQQYAIAGLHPAKSGQGVALSTPAGTPAPFGVGWKAVHPGRELFRKMAPMLLVIAIAALIAILATAYVATRILAHVRQGEQRLLKAELHSSRARAQAAEDLAHSKSAFVANMSHELRTPLNAIIGFSDLMRAETFGPVSVPKYREYLEAIHTSGQHLLHVVNDILNLSKIEAGKMELALQPLFLEGAIREAAGVVEPLAAKKSIGIAVEACCRDIVADRQALQQVLLNLLSNAIKFSHTGQSVEIRARQAGETCEIAVIDRGCGMTQDVLQEIGKPFVQAEGAYSRTNQGTGLGLAISFMLVRAMNGTIAVESTEGIGTTVTVALPMAGGRRSRTHEAFAA